MVSVVKRGSGSVAVVVPVAAVILAVLIFQDRVPVRMRILKVEVKVTVLVAELGMLFAVQAVELTIEVALVASRVEPFVVESEPRFIDPGVNVLVRRPEILVARPMLVAQVQVQVAMAHPEIPVKSGVVISGGEFVMGERRFRRRDDEEARQTGE